MVHQRRKLEVPKYFGIGAYIKDATQADEVVFNFPYVFDCGSDALFGAWFAQGRFSETRRTGRE